MSVFAISDLHLSFSTDKSMTVFGGWDNYVERIEKNWKKTVGENDTVIIPGDVSWAMKLNDAGEDLLFIDKLPGKKILLKGNHDLWWTTMKKINAFLDEKGIKSLRFIYNSAIEVEDVCICGSRGWFYDDALNKKVLLREAQRLDTSITLAKQSGKKPLLFIHYPPVYSGQVCNEIFDVIKKHDIKDVWYGHIHGAGKTQIVTEYEGVKLHLVSCDCVNFTPVLVY